METLYSIQWLNPQTDLYELCQTQYGNGIAVGAIFFSEEAAKEELEDWLDSGEDYRMIEVVLQAVV